MATKPKRAEALTPEFLLGFPFVFKARPPMQAGGDAKFSIMMIFAKAADLTVLKQLAAGAVTAKWGSPENISSSANGFRSPFRDGAEKPEIEGLGAGVIYVNATTQYAPDVVDHNVQPIIDQRAIYGGCVARANIHAFAYAKAGNVGVSFGFSAVQKLRDGKALGGRRDVSEVFTPVAGEEGLRFAVPGTGGESFLGAAAAPALAAPVPAAPVPVAPAPATGLDFLN